MPQTPEHYRKLAAEIRRDALYADGQAAQWERERARGYERYADELEARAAQPEPLPIRPDTFAQVCAQQRLEAEERGRRLVRGALGRMEAVLGSPAPKGSRLAS